MSNVENARAWKVNMLGTSSKGHQTIGAWGEQSLGTKAWWQRGEAAASEGPHGEGAPRSDVILPPFVEEPSWIPACSPCATRRPPHRPGARFAPPPHAPRVSSISALTGMETRTREHNSSSIPAKNLHGKISSVSTEFTVNNKTADNFEGFRFNQKSVVKTSGGGDGVPSSGNMLSWDARPRQPQGGDAPQSLTPSSAAASPSPSTISSPPPPPPESPSWPLESGQPLTERAAATASWHDVPWSSPWQTPPRVTPSCTATLCGASSATSMMFRSECGRDSCSCLTFQTQMDMDAEPEDGVCGARRSIAAMISATVAAAHSASAVADSNTSGVGTRPSDWSRRFFSNLPMRNELDDLLCMLKNTVDEVLVAASELIPAELSQLQLLPEAPLLLLAGGPGSLSGSLTGSLSGSLSGCCGLMPSHVSWGAVDGDCAASLMASQLMDLIAVTAMELSRIPARVDLTRTIYDASDDETGISRGVEVGVRPPILQPDDPRFIGEYRAYLDSIRLPRCDDVKTTTFESFENNVVSQDSCHDGNKDARRSDSQHSTDVSSRTEDTPVPGEVCARELAREEALARAAEQHQSEERSDSKSETLNEKCEMHSSSDGGSEDDLIECGAAAVVAAIEASAAILSTTEEDEGVGASDADATSATQVPVVNIPVVQAPKAQGPNVHTLENEGSQVPRGSEDKAVRGRDTVVLFHRSESDSANERTPARAREPPSRGRRQQWQWPRSGSSDNESAILVSPSSDTDDGAVEMDVIVMPASRQERAKSPAGAPSASATSAAGDAPATDQRHERTSKSSITKSKVKVLVNLDELTQRGCWNTDLCPIRPRLEAGDQRPQQSSVTNCVKLRVRPSVDHVASRPRSGSSASVTRSARHRSPRPAPPRHRQRSPSEELRSPRRIGRGISRRVVERRWAGDRRWTKDRHWAAERRWADDGTEGSGERDSDGAYHQRRRQRARLAALHARHASRSLRRWRRPRAHGRASSASSRFSRRERDRARRNIRSPTEATRTHRHDTQAQALRVRVVASRARYDAAHKEEPSRKRDERVHGSRRHQGWEQGWERTQESEDEEEAARRRYERRAHRSPSPVPVRPLRLRNVSPEADHSEAAEEEEEEEDGSIASELEEECEEESEEEEEEEDKQTQKKRRPAHPEGSSSCGSSSAQCAAGPTEESSSSNSGDEVPESAAAMRRQHKAAAGSESGERRAHEATSTPIRRSRPPSHRVPGWPANKPNVLDMPDISALVDVVAKSATGLLKGSKSSQRSIRSSTARRSTRLADRRPERRDDARVDAEPTNPKLECRLEGTADEESSDFISAVGSPRVPLLPFLTSPGTDSDCESDPEEDSSPGSGATGVEDEAHEDDVTSLKNPTANEKRREISLSNVENLKNKGT